MFAESPRRKTYPSTPEKPDLLSHCVHIAAPPVGVLLAYIVTTMTTATASWHAAKAARHHARDVTRWTLKADHAKMIAIMRPIAAPSDTFGRPCTAAIVRIQRAVHDAEVATFVTVPKKRSMPVAKLTKGDHLAGTSCPTQWYCETRGGGRCDA